MITRIEKYYADWCFPCKMLDKTLAQLPENVKIDKINIEEDVEKAESKNIRNIPVLIYYNENDEEITRTIGNIPFNKILEIINE